MKIKATNVDLDYRWAGITAISGIAGFISYIVVLAAEQVTAYAVALAFGFAFGIAVSSIGIYHILGGAAGPRLGLIAAVANVTATALLLAMLLVQMSVKAVVPQSDAALKAIWLGLDVAWDLYIGAGTILFALCMFGRRGLGAWLAIPGLLVGALLLAFNIATFPTPPANAGLVDVGPLVGLWYLVVYVRLGISSVLLKRHPRKSTAELSTQPGLQ
jgi:hypothetical protein